MNINKIYKKTGKLLTCAVLSSSLFGLASCTDDFEQINKNPLFPDKEMEKLDNTLYGMYLPNLQKTVIPIGTHSDNTEFDNKYQVGVNLTGDAWSGYLAATENKFDGGQNLTNYFFADHRKNYIYGFMVTDVFTPWLQIKKHSQGEGVQNDEIFSLAQIIKIAALHRATDTFGPIPYKGVGSGDFHVAYNSQEEVYHSFFEELEKAIQTLTLYSEANPKMLDEFDVVYEGDVNKWIKFANSLMLRLAVRVRYADPALAQKYAEQAVNHPKGLIETPAEAPQMGKGAGIQFKHPLYTIWHSYNDTRMGATMYTYLKGYEDPRTEKYFSTARVNNDFAAIRTGIPHVGYYKDDADAKGKSKYFSAPNFEEDSPLFWMTASEVLFLKAEGALAGWSMGGSAQSLYEEGIRMSFKEHEVGNANSYIASSKTPARYDDPRDSKMSINAPSQVTVRWGDASSDEERLEKIITQKYLAIYPNGIEAWTEWRRTGYPRQIIVAENVTNSDVETGNGVKGGVRRIPFPKDEYDNNLENVQDAINKYLGGQDKANINVWWDKKNK